MSPAQNAPSIAALVVAFASAVLTWGVDSVDLPAEVETTGLALALAVVAVAAGKVTQRFFTEPKTPPDLSGDDGLPHGDPTL